MGGDHRPAGADPDDLAPGYAVDGETMQDARTSDLVFSVLRLIAELSSVLPLLPGEVIFTGRRRVSASPPSRRALSKVGNLLETWIEGIGTMRNRCV